MFYKEKIFANIFRHCEIACLEIKMDYFAAVRLAMTKIFHGGFDKLSRRKNP